MPNHQTILRCSQTTATILFILIGSLFLITGCRGLYKSIGLTDEQANAQVQADNKVIALILGQTRTTTAQIITSAIAGLGTIASGFLAKWLRTERKISAALIHGIEKSDAINVKATVQKKAIASGIESKLNKRVQALT